ncbi:MAG: hybrid sensor histidine kinase/response regulator, partial [Acidobacteriota bacterium]
LRRPDIRVIFMSGHSQDVIKMQGGTKAASDLLQKPFVPHELVRKVREVLDRPRSGATPPVSQPYGHMV